MYNKQIDKLTNYPFKRLDDLLSGINPPKNITPNIMSIGEPQHPAPSIINEEINNCALLWNKYPPVKGTKEFRLSIQNWLLKRFNLPDVFIDPEKNILPLAGSREGLYMTGQLTIPKDKKGKKPVVLLPNPFYQVYLGSALLSGAETIMLDLNKENNFQHPVHNLDNDILNRTSTLFICNPSNPQGSVASKKYLTELIFLARKYNFILIADECYSEIYYNEPPTGLLEAAFDIGEGLKNILIFNSLSKRSNAPGLRSGFVVGDEILIDKFLKLRSHASAVQPLPIMAVAKKLWEDEVHVIESRNMYREKIYNACKIIGDSISFEIPAGGFFLWLNVKNGTELTKKLWKKAAIKVLPGKFLSTPDKYGISPGDEYIRVALVHDKEKTDTAIKKIVDIYMSSDTN